MVLTNKLLKLFGKKESPNQFTQVSEKMSVAQVCNDKNTANKNNGDGR